MGAIKMTQYNDNSKTMGTTVLKYETKATTLTIQTFNKKASTTTANRMQT